MDSLIKALNTMGMRLSVRAREQRGIAPYRQWETVVAVEGVNLVVELIEKTKQVPHELTSDEQKRKSLWPFFKPQPYDLRPAGKLKFAVTNAQWLGVQHSWSDGKRQRLEDMLGKIVVGFDLLAKTIKRRDERRLADQHAQREAQHRREAEQRRFEYLQALANDLEQKSEAWSRAKRIRAFLAAVEQELDTATADGNTVVWLEWARQYATELDPLSNSLVIPKMPEWIESSPDSKARILPTTDG